MSTPRPTVPFRPRSMGVDADQLYVICWVFFVALVLFIDWPLALRALLQAKEQLGFLLRET